MADDQINGWDFQEQIFVNSNNMLRVLQSKIMKQPFKLNMQQIGVKNRRPLTGRQLHSAMNNFSSTQPTTKILKYSAKNKYHDIENQKPCSKLHTQNARICFQANEQIRIKQKPEQFSVKQQSENILKECSQSKKNVLEKQFGPIQPQIDHHNLTIKLKTGQQFPMKKQSLIFSSLQTLKNKGINKNKNGVPKFHEMDIKMTKIKPQQVKSLKIELQPNQYGYTSKKQIKPNNWSIGTESINQSVCSKNYTSYSHRKKQSKYDKQKIGFAQAKLMKNIYGRQSQIFGDLHFSERIIFRY